jgi:hypothetical protein
MDKPHQTLDFKSAPCENGERTGGKFALKIDDVIQRLLERAIDQGYSRRSLALACGLSENAFRGMDFSDRGGALAGKSNITLSTLRAIEAVVGPTPETPDGDRAELAQPVVYRERHTGAESDNAKAVVWAGSLPRLDPILANAKRYIDHLIGSKGLLRSQDISLRLLSDVAPNVKCHIVNIGDDLSSSDFQRWHTVSDFRGGHDMTGARLDEGLDPALARCFGGDCLKVARTGLDQVAVLNRTIRWAGSKSPSIRSVVRWMGAAIGPDGQPQVVTIARRHQSIEKTRNSRRGAPGEIGRPVGEFEFVTGT